MRASEDFLCAPRFFQSAICELSQFSIPLESIAKGFDVAVLAGCENPFRLRTVRERGQTGVSIEQVMRLAPQILAEVDLQIVFRHIPFELVPYRMFPELLDDLISASSIVGVGYDVGVLLGEPQGYNKHVSRIVPRSSNTVTILDEDVHVLVGDLLSWEKIELSVRAIHDGFWVLFDADHPPSSDLLPRLT